LREKRTDWEYDSILNENVDDWQKKIKKEISSKQIYKGIFGVGTQIDGLINEMKESSDWPKLYKSTNWRRMKSGGAVGLDLTELKKTMVTMTMS